MKTYSVSEDFILEAYKEAGHSLKVKLEKRFPDLFPKGDKILYQFIPYDDKDIPNMREESVFYFSIGDRIQIVDGSYHLNSNLSKINESLGLTNPKGIIVYNRSNHYYESFHGCASLNLVIRLDDGRIILSSPVCVKKL